MRNRFNLIGLCMLIFLAVMTLGIPEGGDITFQGTSSHTPAAADTVNAVAGQVTEVLIDVNSSTKTWAGYYGNLTGTMILGNSEEKYLYSWSLENPRGEVYMVNESITFENIECWNDTRTDSGTYYTLSEYENWLGITSGADDRVNNTFSTIGGGTHSEFFVGHSLISANSCPATNLYNSSGVSESGKWEEVLLYEPTNEVIVYTALVEQNEIGFDGKEYDFQMIVGDNGHIGAGSTSYYLYTELE